MPKGKGYKKRNRWDESNNIGVNTEYSTPHQKVIQIQPRPKALGMGKVGRIGITSMGNTSTGKKGTTDY